MAKSDKNPHGVPAEGFEQMRQGIRKDRAQFLKDFFPSFYGQGTRGGGVSEGILHWSWKMAMQASLRGTLGCIDAFGSTDFSDDLGTIACETLAIHGTKDVTVPIEATAHRVAKMVRGAELIEYDGAPHGLLSTHSAKVTEDLKRFLA